MMLYVHHVPGRLRLRTPMLKGRPQAAQSACDTAIGILGVTEVRANAATGSLLITYDRHRATPATLWQALREHGLAAGPLPIKEGAPVTRAEIHCPEPSESGVFAVVAGLCLDKLLEHSAAALLGALI